MLIVAVGVAAAAASTSPAAACLLASTCERPSLKFELTQLEVTPRALPERAPAPVAVSGGARISTTVGPRPPALREAVVEVDRDVALALDGLPACGYRQLATRETDAARRACRPAIVGWGSAVFLLHYPENSPIPLKTHVTLFHGGARGRATRLFLHGFLPIRLPRAIVAPVRLEPAPGGQGGWRATVEIPRASEGYGSLVEFALTVRRAFRAGDGVKHSFLSARCPDGRFEVAMSKLVFKNETGMPQVPPQTILKRSAFLPCAPKRSR